MERPLAQPRIQSLVHFDMAGKNEGHQVGDRVCGRVCVCVSLYQ